MARKISSLYNGFIQGTPLTPIKLGPNNPKFDTTSAGVDAVRVLGAHTTKGVKKHASVDGPAKAVARQPGRKVNGAARIKGGKF